jgi:transcriptional regulator with XRE-family HTH domain
MRRGTFHKAFAAVLREKRAAKQLSQERLAHEGGFARQYVGMIERGERRPTLEACHALALVLGTPLSELVGEAERRTQRGR